MREALSTDTFLNEVLAILKEQIKENLPSIREAILKSGKEFILKSRKDLGRWNAMLATGAITPEEYGWLVEARVSVAELNALMATGLALARLDDVRQALIRSITGAALGVVGL